MRTKQDLRSIYAYVFFKNLFNVYIQSFSYDRPTGFYIPIYGNFSLRHPVLAPFYVFPVLRPLVFPYLLYLAKP